MVKQFYFIILIIAIVSCSSEKKYVSIESESYNTWIGEKIKKLKLPTTYQPRIFDSLGFAVYHYIYQRPNIYAGIVENKYYYLSDISQFYFVDKTTKKIKDIKTLAINSKVLCYGIVPFVKTIDDKVIRGEHLILDSIYKY